MFLPDMVWGKGCHQDNNGQQCSYKEDWQAARLLLDSRIFRNKWLVVHYDLKYKTNIKTALLFK